MVIGGIVGVFTARGFVSGIRRDAWETATLSEWLIGAGVGLLTAVMVAVLIRSMF